MNRTCPDLSLCQAGDACAGHCRKPHTITVTKPLQAPSEVLQGLTSGLYGCYPGCFYYSDSCFRQDCKR